MKVRLKLEASGWKGARGTAIAQSPQTRGFYSELARWASRSGALALLTLKLDGRAVAFHYGLEHGERFFLLKPGYEPTSNPHPEEPPKAASRRMVADTELAAILPSKRGLLRVRGGLLTPSCPALTLQKPA